MLKRLLELFTGPPPDPVFVEHRTLVAAAAILQELAACDADFHALERTRILRVLREDFAVPAELADAVMSSAETARAANHSTFAFATIVRDDWDLPRKREVLTAMWKVVLADGRLADEEAKLVTSFSSLLQVSAREVAAARAKARESRTGHDGGELSELD